MTMNRRSFLRQSFATSGLVAYGLSAPTFLARTAKAASSAGDNGDFAVEPEAIENHGTSRKNGRSRKRRCGGRREPSQGF